MNTKIIDRSEFVRETPSEEGQYLWFNGTTCDLITVIRYPEKDDYGIHWDSYLGVPSFGGRNVGNLRGLFLKLEIS